MECEPILVFPCLSAGIQLHWVGMVSRSRSPVAQTRQRRPQKERIMNRKMLTLMTAAAMGGLVLSGCDTQATGPEFAVVEKVTPIKVSTSTPKQVCEDRAVTTRLPERDGNTGGTVAGAVIGGLLGNQVGKGDGKKAATLAGAIAGGVAGHEIDKRHEGGREVAEIQQDCRTVQQTQSRIDGYTVEYLYKGQRHQVRMAEAPKDGRVEVRSDGSLIDS
ncbi:MAG: glycine zipper 2TM domain-containing protein [Rhodanobacteraceae bacterium]|nr:glycine zipper 2TM domain-containing protein [Rhodanobacteraceae bacterium]